MKEWKTVVISDKIINDDKLSDAEFRLLSRIILKYGTNSPENETVRLKFNNDFEEFHISRSSFFRLLAGLVKREYLQRDSRTDSYSFSRSISKYFSPINETTQSQKSDCETMRRDNEEESTKEEDKENSQSDSSYIYNNIKENEKEREIPKREKPEPETDKADRFTGEYREIIDYLNEKTGKKFSARSRVNQGHMSARLKEGFTVEDFKRVIDVKVFQWHDDPKMAKFLRPETLFGTKFDRYLNEEKYVMREGLHGEKYMVTEDEMNSDLPF